MFFITFVVILILIGMFISFVDKAIGFNTTMDWRFTVHQILTMVGGALVLLMAAKGNTDKREQEREEEE